MLRPRIPIGARTRVGLVPGVHHVPIGVALAIAALVAPVARAAPPGAPAPPPRAAAAAPLNADGTAADRPDAAVRADTSAADTPAAGSAAAGVMGMADTSAAPVARDYETEMRADFGAEDRAYARLKILLRIVRPLAGVLIAMLALFSGLAAGLRTVAHALGHRRYPRLLVFLLLYVAAVTVLELPLAWYDSFALEHQFGLSNQTFGAWLADEGKTALVGVLTFGLLPILWLVYLAIEKSPRRWWLWLAAGSIPLVIAGTLLQPLVFDPLFNSFRPLRDPRLAVRILDLAERADIPARQVFEVDKSAQTRKINAYVSGFGASQRIVLWDTTLQAMREDEILFVMAHEIGHYKLGHIWQGIVFSSALGFALLFLSQRLCTAALRRFGARWGVPAMHDVASLPLLMATVGLLAFFAQPVVNAYSRAIETQTDVYGLELTRDNDAAARAFLALARQNRSDPDPPAWVKLLVYSHPPGLERARLARDYRPWETGAPNRYLR